MDIPLIGAGIGLGESIFGAIQTSKANKKMDELEKNKPVYSRPDEVKQYLEMAKTNAGAKMPGETLFNENIQQSTQGAVSKLQEAGQLDPASIQKLYQSEMGAYNNLAFQQSQYYQTQQEQLQKALSESAKYSDQEFEYNVNTPWQRKYNRAINKYEAGQQLMGQGMNTMAGSIMSETGQQQSQGQSSMKILPTTPSILNTAGMLSTPLGF
jgi:hypothetical protein